MNEQKEIDEIKNLISDFLFYLEKYLNYHSIVDGISVVYAQEPIILSKKIKAKGAVKVNNKVYPFLVQYDAEFGNVELRSSIFEFYLSVSDIKQFVREMKANEVFSYD